MDDDRSPEVDPNDPNWSLEGDDSLGDADDPHRNDDQNGERP